MNIVLASKSPRRIEIMRNHGIDPIIMPSDIEENPPLYEGLHETPMFLALKKALDIESKTASDCKDYIIAADTIVYSDHAIGKPEDKEDALEILMSLSGKKHFVATGCAIIKAHKPVRRCFTVVTEVHFKSYTAEELDDYLNTDEPYDKAGAYAIQGYFGRYIDHFEGSLDNVIGFPWEEIEAELKDMGYETPR